MNVVVWTPDVVGRRMAGPGIRAFHLAAELGRHVPTTLLANLVELDTLPEHFEAVDHRATGARRRLEAATVVIGQPARELLGLGRGRRMVFDLFDPVVLELRELYGPRPRLRQGLHATREWGRLRMALARGDLLIAATERQRDFYAGIQAASGGSTDGWNDRWIMLPFGVEEPPPPEEPRDDQMIVWGGGLWEWLDPKTAIEAVRIVRARGIDCRLEVPGGRRPNEGVAAALDGTSGIDLLLAGAGDLVTRTSEWIPYAERGRWIGRARAAIMLHKATLEAEFSIRTRLFDAIWCAVPLVASRGGFAADLIEEESLGVVVRPEEPVDVADGIERLITDDAFHRSCVSRLREVRARFAWSRVVQPLIEAIQRWS